MRHTISRMAEVFVRVRVFVPMAAASSPHACCAGRPGVVWTHVQLGAGRTARCTSRGMDLVPEGLGFHHLAGEGIWGRRGRLMMASPASPAHPLPSRNRQVVSQCARCFEAPELRRAAAGCRPSSCRDATPHNVLRGPARPTRPPPPRAGRAAAGARAATRCESGDRRTPDLFPPGLVQGSLPWHMHVRHAPCCPCMPFYGAGRLLRVRVQHLHPATYFSRGRNSFCSRMHTALGSSQQALP